MKAEIKELQSLNYEGIRIKMISLILAPTGKEPEFVATDDYLKTTLYR